MLKRHIKRFLLVGALGFLVDISVLGVMVHAFDIDPIISRLVAFAGAVWVTYYFNSHYTYGIHPREVSFRRYMTVQIMGAAINLGSYTWLVLAGGLADYPMVALACGSALGTINNFTLSRKFVFLE